MGKRCIIVKQAAIGEILAPRGKDTGVLVRVVGPDLPADAKIVGALFIPPAQAFAVFYESAKWTDLVVPGGGAGNGVNGVPVLDGAKNLHVFIVDSPGGTPGCQIPGIDPPVLTNVAADADFATGCEVTTEGDGAFSARVALAAQRLNRLRGGESFNAVYEGTPTALPAGGMLADPQAIEQFERDRRAIETAFLSDYADTQS